MPVISSNVNAQLKFKSSVDTKWIQKCRKCRQNKWCIYANWCNYAKNN